MQQPLDEKDKLACFRNASAAALFFAYIFNGVVYSFYKDIPEPFNLITSLLSLQFSFLIACLVPALLLFKRNELPKIFKISKLDKLQALQISVFAVFIFPLILIIAIISAELAASFNINFDDRLSEFLKTQNELSMGFLIFAGIFIAPLVEEIAFRFCLFDYFRDIFKKTHIILPIIVNSLVFSLLHNDPLRVPALFLLGIVLQYILLKYKTLLAAILFHCVHNILSFAAFYIFSYF